MEACISTGTGRSSSGGGQSSAGTGRSSLKRYALLYLLIHIGASCTFASCGLVEYFAKLGLGLWSRNEIENDPIVGTDEERGPLRGPFVVTAYGTESKLKLAVRIRRFKTPFSAPFILYFCQLYINLINDTKFTKQ